MIKVDFKGVKKFTSLLEGLQKDFEKKVKRATTRGATHWQTEAKLRVPVETGTTRNTILKEVVTNERGEIEGAVGSNQKHAPFIEFGTTHIAGGKVKALGIDPEITDQDAVHTWAAKEENAIDMTSAKIGKDGRLRDARGKFIGGGGRSQEQMPWLRASFMASKPKIVKMLADAVKFR